MIEYSIDNYSESNTTEDSSMAEFDVVLTEQANSDPTDQTRCLEVNLRNDEQCMKNNSHNFTGTRHESESGEFDSSISVSGLWEEGYFALSEESFNLLKAAGFDEGDISDIEENITDNYFSFLSDSEQSESSDSLDD